MMSKPQEPTPPQPVKQKCVFVSSSRETRDLAKFVSRKLREMGIHVSNDDSVAPGTELRNRLKDEIRRADAIITLVTPSSVDSDWMQYEVGLATGLDRLVIPVVVDVQTEQLPAQIATRRMLRLDELDQIEELIGSAVADAASE